MPIAILDFGLVALVLGLAGPPDAGTDLPAGAEVVAATLDVFDEPDPASYIPARLRRGDRVTVRDIERGGWLVIDPPPGSFCWIDQKAIRAADGVDHAEVIVARAEVRSGRPGARLPGGPRRSLTRGATVRLLDLPPLILGRGKTQRTWRAVAPPGGEVCHVRADGVAWTADRPRHPEPAAEVRAAFDAPGSGPIPAPPHAIAAEIARVEASHRAILRAPVETWRLESIRGRYEALLRTVTDAASGNAIRARLEQVGRHEEIAQAARTIQTILDRSHRRDGALAQAQRRLARVEEPRTAPYQAEGLIQASSRKVDGQKVFALIGPEGTTDAYLDLPAGLDPRPLVARRVGVRGKVHYSEPLRARLITVSDLDPLDEGPGDRTLVVRPRDTKGTKK